MVNAVHLSQLLPAGRVLVGLEAKTYREAVMRLADRLDEAGLIEDRLKLNRLVDDEIATGDLPTLGGRALLAHYRTDAVRELAVGIASSREPFPFAPKAGASAVFLVLIVAPRTAANYYLKTLAALSRLLNDKAIAKQLAAAASAETFSQIVASHDFVIHPDLAVQDLMSRQFHTVSPETLLSEALHLMVRHGRRGLPVVSDNGEVLGLVTEVEVIQHFLPQVLGPGSADEGAKPPVEDVEVRDVMQRTVLCLSEEQLIVDVLGIMLSERSAQLPVVRGGKLVGLLSRTDIITKLLEHSV